MSAIYPIESAKTALRNAYNSGNVQGVLEAFADCLTNMTEGEPSFWGPEAKQAMALNLRKTFADYNAQLAVVIIDISIYGDIAFEHGWYKVQLTPKHGGHASSTKYRYCERWQKQPDGSWKIDFVMTNKEHPPRMLPAQD